MPRFEVEIRQSKFFYYEVEAKTAEEAREKVMFGGWRPAPVDECWADEEFCEGVNEVNE